MSLVQPKKLLLTYEVYKQHNGFVAPQINDEDIANGLNTPEDKFQKWSMYSQIMLNAVLMDELSMVDYTLTNIDKKAQIAIIDIMVTRLTRAFHNDELIPRNSQVSYSQQGGIQYSSTGTIDSKDALYSFFDDRERLLIQTSGLLETVFAAPQADETNELLDNQFMDGPKVNEVNWGDKQDTIIAFNGTNMSVLQALEFLKAGKVDVDTLTTSIQTATGLTRDQAAGIILVADNNFIKYSTFRENKAETEIAQVKDVQLSEARSRADIVINQKTISQTNRDVVDTKARVTKTEAAALDYYENKDKFARVEDLIGIEVVINLGNLAVTQATSDNAAEGILTGDLVTDISAINQTTLQENTKLEVKYVDPAGNITDIVVIDTYKDGSFTDDEIDGDGIKVRVSGTRIILRKGDSTTTQEWAAIVAKMTQMKANRIYQIKGTVGGTIDAQARQDAATAQQKANDAYAATQTNQQAINDINVTKTVNEAGTTEEFQDLDGTTNPKQQLAQKGYVDTQVNNLKSGIAFYAGQIIPFNVEQVAPSKFADTTLFDKSIVETKPTLPALDNNLEYVVMINKATGKQAIYSKEIKEYDWSGSGSSAVGTKLFDIPTTERIISFNGGEYSNRDGTLTNWVRATAIKYAIGYGNNKTEATYANGSFTITANGFGVSLVANVKTEKLTLIKDFDTQYKYIAKKDITFAEMGE